MLIDLTKDLRFFISKTGMRMSQLPGERRTACWVSVVNGGSGARVLRGLSLMARIQPAILNGTSAFWELIV